MKSLFTILALSMTVGIFAQDAYKSITIDGKTNEPIPYVNIGIKDASTGTVSDHKGRFVLKMHAPNDVVIFSSIGYETLEAVGSELVAMDVVKMKATDYLIPQIEIKARRFDGDEKMFGVKNEKRGLSVGFGGPQLGTEIGAPIYIDRPTYIKSANFVLNHAKGDSLLFRINIYDYQDGKIGEKVLRENVNIAQKQQKGTITVDLTPYDLVLENSVLLSLEWLRDYDELGSKGVTFDTRKSKDLKGIYVRLVSNRAIEQLPFKRKIKPCFYFMGKQSRQH